MLANGVEGSRPAIPWNLVGDGWTVVVWSPSADPNDQGQAIYLVDPLGGRYRIASVPKSAQVLVGDVSADRRHALLLERLHLGRVYQVDLRTGYIEQVSVPADTGAVEYGDPAASSIITASSSTVRRTSPSGTIEHTFAALVAPGYGGAGSLPLVSPDGSHLVFAANNSLAWMDRNGQGKKNVAVSPSYSGCTPIRWWQPGVVLASCSKNSAARLWLVPLDGSAPSVLDRPAQGGVANSNAWRLGIGTIVAHGPSCGTGVQLDRLDGTALPIPAPVPNDGFVRVAGVTSDSIYLITGVQCQGNTIEALVRYDYIRNTSTVLFGGSVRGGSVRFGLTLGVDH